MNCRIGMVDRILRETEIFALSHQSCMPSIIQVQYAGTPPSPSDSNSCSTSTSDNSCPGGRTFIGGGRMCAYAN